MLRKDIFFIFVICIAQYLYCIKNYLDKSVELVTAVFLLPEVAVDEWDLLQQFKYWNWWHWVTQPEELEYKFSKPNEVLVFHVMFGSSKYVPEGVDDDCWQDSQQVKS